jgi:hypothetical protein
MALTGTNLTGTAFASAARTATGNSGDLDNGNAKGVVVFVNVTATAATPSVTFAIQAKDPASGEYVSLLVSAAVTAAGMTMLTVYPGVTAAANVSASAVLPKTWRVLATHGDADSITYSVGYSLIR